MSQPVPAVHSEFARKLTSFTARLRGLGFQVGPGETEAAARALDVLNVLDPGQAQDALRMILTAHRAQEPVFNRAFREHFLLPTSEDDASQPSGVQKPDADSAAKPDQEQPRPEAPLEGEGEPTTPAGRQQQASSDDEDDAAEAQNLRSRMSPHAGRSEEDAPYGGELEDLLHAASALIRRVKLGRTRRWKAAPRGTRFDFRRTLHAALRTGGDPATPRFQRHPLRSPRFLIVLDASRSMAPHTDLLLRYAAALMLRTRRVEVYSFSTTLTRLTPLLRQSLTHSLERSLGAGQQHWSLSLPPLGDAWGGGTRIGENLQRLIGDERARLSPSTVTIILSDGLDTGEPQKLAHAVRELHRLSARLVWLNPLAGLPGYLPLARGMAAALPHLDVFAAAGGVAELAALPEKLKA
ncbi:VWA domain-containing protein [Deinococcus sp. KNUC1210]|uniref:vWA domain-containing protein n=1 Tax=Deinococcus sp. KNUC1210 TaxID=2917691 RepID=UPI001EF1140E|nr:VWA domain-containing protein [Deinococcus sp. KNUC1210]ULH16815.1 VWA domain-containing protein [Deinococcus sp. KNUC1210]